MLNNDKISIIIPVYNVEKYIDKCINSIVNQTYQNLEIILVDDGSPDNCPKICDEWAKKDDRIKVIHKENGGLSSARNYGLEKCTGKYICFVDSDDYVEKTYVEKLYNLLINSKGDLALCGINYITEQGELYDIVEPIEKTLYNNDEKFDLFYLKNIMVVVAWNKLYKRSIWESLRYPIGKKNEDEFVIYDIIKQCKNGITITNEKLYNYVYRENSIMTTKTSKGIFDPIEALNDRYAKTDDKNLKNFIANDILNYYIKLYRKFHKDSISHKILLSFKEDYKKYKNNITSGKQKLKFFIFKNLPKVLLIKK